MLASLAARAIELCAPGLKALSHRIRRGTVRYRMTPPVDGCGAARRRIRCERTFSLSDLTELYSRLYVWLLVRVSRRAA